MRGRVPLPTSQFDNDRHGGASYAFDPLTCSAPVTWIPGESFYTRQGLNPADFLGVVTLGLHRQLGALQPSSDPLARHPVADQLHNLRLFHNRAGDSLVYVRRGVSWAAASKYVHATHVCGHGKY
jgi:hypothetical protein